MSGHANMALARECCLFLVLFILVSLARCENKAPKVSLRGRVDYPRRGAPSADSPVPPDHVFYHNHQLDFSWTDPALQMALWRGLKTEQQLQAEFGAKARRKRQSPGSPGPTNTNPRAVFQLPSCAGCVAAANGAPPPTLQSLSVQYLGNQIKYTPPELYNGCVFYTAVVGPTDFVVRRRLGGTDVHPGLSKIASDWACSNGRKSIWQLYNGANDVTGATDNPGQYNFWEIYTPGSWLAPLFDQRFQYFAQMSEAMANACGGTIFVMSLNPTNLAGYGYIWGNSEFPTLQARSTFIQGNLPPTQLIAVDAANTGRMFLMSWADMSVISQISSKKRSTSRSEPSEEDEIEYDVDYVEEGETEYPIAYVEDLPESVRKTLIKQKDVKRDTDTCSLNVNYEPPSDDWFGLGGAVIAPLFLW